MSYRKFSYYMPKIRQADEDYSRSFAFDGFKHSGWVPLFVPSWEYSASAIDVLYEIGWYDPVLGFVELDFTDPKTAGWVHVYMRALEELEETPEDFWEDSKSLEDEQLDYLAWWESVQD